MEKNQNSLIKLLCFFLIFLTPFFFLKTTSPPSKITAPILPLPTAVKISPEEISLLAMGDVMLGRHCNVQMLDYKNWNYPFLETANLTSSNNIVFANLEAPFFVDCPTTSSGMVFCAREEAIQGLLTAGINLVSLENNHMLNYGQEGLAQTKELLDQNQISYTDSQELTVKTTNRVSLGFLAFDLVTYPQTDILSKVSENKDLVDILIVSLHWGAEYQLEPNKQQEILAHQIIDAGAKIIIGHHPHVVQPIEEYKDGLIFYSLGNFVFDQSWSEETKKGAIAKVIFTGKELKSYEVYPVYSKNYCQPQLVNESMN